jgi:hypothetical protein
MTLNLEGCKIACSSNWDLGNRLSICLKIEESQENLCREGRRAGPSRCMLTTFEAWSLCKYYFKIHFLPQRKHNASRLQIYFFSSLYSPVMNLRLLLFFCFRNLFRHTAGLLGRVINSSQGLYLHWATQHRKTRRNIHALSGIRTRDQGPRLRPHGHWIGLRYK